MMIPMLNLRELPIIRKLLQSEYQRGYQEGYAAARASFLGITDSSQRKVTNGKVPTNN